MDTCCSFILKDLEQARIDTLTGRRLVDGPGLFNFYWPCFETPYITQKIQLDPNEMLEINYKTRISIIDILRHDYFKEYDYFHIFWTFRF